MNTVRTAALILAAVAVGWLAGLAALYVWLAHTDGWDIEI